MRLIFVGTPATAVPVAERLTRDHEVCAVLTRPPAAQGRSSRLVPSEVEEWALDHGIEILHPATLRDSGVVARIRQIAPDCCPVVAYGGLITRELLAIPEFGWINLHYSLLPAYRGAAPVQRALLDGCTTTGVTVFRIVPALDAGPVFVQQPVEVDPLQTAGDLLSELSLIGADAMVDALDMARQGRDPVPQSAEGVCLAPKITPEEARLDLADPAQRLLNVIRAMSPEPGAWLTLDGQRFKILRAAIAPAPIGVADDAAPGYLWATKKKLFCRVCDGWMELIEVQAQGKKPMPGADWARGAWREGACCE